MQRRRVSKHDGRLGWVKKLKTQRRWISVERYCEQNGWEIKHWRRKKRKTAKPKVMPPQVSQPRPAPPSPASKIRPGELTLAPRQAKHYNAIRESFSKGRVEVVIEKRRLPEPLSELFNAVPADKA